MSCDWLADAPALLMLAGWVLLPVSILLVRTGVNRHRRARTMLLRANDRLRAAGEMVEAVERHLPYPPAIPSKEVD